MKVTLKQENLIETDFGEPYQYCENSFYGDSVEGCTSPMYKDEEVVFQHNGEYISIYCIACSEETN